MDFPAIMRGGLTHLRYAHQIRPVKLQVSCPTCQKIATAFKTSEMQYSPDALITDLSPTFSQNDWQVQCVHCMKRLENLYYNDLPILYFSQGSYGIWAWNTKHVQFLISFFEKKEISKHPYYGWRLILKKSGKNTQ